MTAWLAFLKGKSEQKPVGRCIVTGEQTAIERNHPDIRGIRNGDATGNVLISFNTACDAYESFGNQKSAGLNAPVGEYATFAYSTILNRFLTDARHNFVVGDCTLVFWADSTETDKYSEAFRKVLRSNDTENSDISYVTELLSCVDFDLATDFYIMGVTPNSKRLAITLFMHDTFGNSVKKFEKYDTIFQIEKQFENQPSSISVDRIMYELNIHNDKTKSFMLNSLIKAILYSKPIPEMLFDTILRKVKADNDTNYYRLASLKAFLINNKKYTEVLTVSLNTETDNTAYVLGRLFAVLEKVQAEAQGDIKATIKKRYFATACSYPAQVFPSLMRLATHHIAKAKYGRYRNRLIEELHLKLNAEKPYPASLSLEDQGVFITGYYHQYNDFFKPKNENKIKVEEN